MPSAIADFRIAVARKGSWTTRTRVAMIARMRIAHTKYRTTTNMEENPYQGDMMWTVSEVSDMCIPDD